MAPPRPGHTPAAFASGSPEWYQLGWAPHGTQSRTLSSPELASCYNELKRPAVSENFNITNPKRQRQLNVGAVNCNCQAQIYAQNLQSKHDAIRAYQVQLLNGLMGVLTDHTRQHNNCGCDAGEHESFHAAILQHIQGLASTCGIQL